MHGMTRREVRERIGAKIMWFRAARCISRRRLSDLSDIPEILLGRIENGRIRVTFENMLCIARALGVPVVEFFGDEEDDG